MDHHGGGGGESGDSQEKSCPMIMVFHGGHCERILWKGWVASTISEFVLSAVAIFAVAFLYEVIKFLREYLLRQVARKEAEKMALELQNNKTVENVCAIGACSNTPLAEVHGGNYWQRIFGGPHLAQTLLNFIQVLIAYLLMLVVMTFNYWLCLAVLLGLGLGYFFFGWIKKDLRDCCS